MLTYTKAKRLTLKSHPQFTERWLHDRIAEDPEILGLGSVVLLDRERRQHRAGRLDLLLAQPEDELRYEVELMLGPTDESHIIRTLEYWDIERRRYPGYEHIAVIVAEDITSRFLNVLSLLSGTIPLIAIQIDALEVGEQIVLNFVRVLDQTALRQDDVEVAPAETTDRTYWIERTSQKIVESLDHMLAMVNGMAGGRFQLNYNKRYVGLSDGSKSRNFIHFYPKKNFVKVLAEVSDKGTWMSRIEEAGLDATQHGARWIKTTFTLQDMKQHEELLRELLTSAWEDFSAE